MTRITLALMWLLHWLPLPWLAACGHLFGRLFYRFGHARRHIALTNLGLCFPTLSEIEKSALARRHFEAFGRSFLERGLLWWASPERIRRIVRLEGLAHIPQDRPVILLAPHFVGLDMGWTRLTLERDLVSMYSNQKNPVFNAALHRGRLRFGHSALLSRQEGTRRAIKALKAGTPFYYLPDMDYGAQDAIFVPFFGVPAATITGLSRLARMTGAAVLPVITRLQDDGYVVEIGAAWSDFPGESIETDTRRMNAFIEDAVRPMPEQYFWLHRRFKTRPPGEMRPY
ncbi:MAG: lipid A biosynthesis acyltransferase [Rhodocyclaceae bacterium]|nr:lipid A biosynthesis acyltransferase [Rhodocyclaceae bacterium]MDZ4215875.1 lipid A biosynthesis acyltransferase [Rhodocyclaceae bacterium]